jgi:hypothetical protein
MAHWAELDDNNIVLRVTVGSNEEPDEGYQWLIDNLGGRWVQTSYTARLGKKMDPNNNWELTEQPGFRKNYAGPGFTYDEELDAFIPPKPYPSWVLNEETGVWDAPTPPGERPDWDHDWDEESLSWVPRQND